MKTDQIVLSDGKEYTITEYDIGDFVEIEQKFGTLELDTSKLEAPMFWLWLSLRKAHTKLELKQLYSLVTASFLSSNKLVDVFDKVMKLNGMNTASKNEQRPVE